MLRCTSCTDTNPVYLFGACSCLPQLMLASFPGMDILASGCLLQIQLVDFIYPY